MCGISAIASHQPVASALYQCLQNLEYRGYDSCGIATYTNKSISLRKNAGNVAEVNDLEHFSEMEGCFGIAHTRWATHGGVTAKNSHPHFSNSEEFVIVHNGIFSNYQQLKKELTGEGFQFLSETDTEVFANLLQREFQKSKNVEDAFCAALKIIEGSYAIAMITIHQPDVIFAAKKESPLVIGLAEGTNYISSDINAFISETRDTILIDDGEYVILDNNHYAVKRIDNHAPVHKKVLRVNWDRQTAQRGGFSHYMLKEIFDQPQTVQNALHIPDVEIDAIAAEFINKEQSFCVGVGTTYYVAMIGTYLFSQFANMYVPAVSSDEFPELIPISQSNHVLYFSQSGETYDTRMAIKWAKENQASTSSIVNVVGSSISQMVDHCIYQGSGPEICVVSTKAAVSQIILLWMIALKVGLKNKTLSQTQYDQYRTNLKSLSTTIEKVINEESGFIRQLALQTSKVKNWLFMGKGIYYPVAMESALKMKEVTYIHAEGLPSGFLKHGTLAMIDESLYSIFFLPTKEDSDVYRSSLMAIEEVKARNGKVIAFCAEHDSEVRDLVDHPIIIPETHSELQPIVEMIIAQLFSYYSALHMGLNIDKPRNLAKSVTVG